MSPITALIADGQDVRGFGTRLYLHGHETSAVEVVGHAIDGDEALMLSVEHGPHAIVLDPAIERNGGSALWLCLALKLYGTRVPKVVLFAGAEEIPGDPWDFYATTGAESFPEAGEELDVLFDVVSRTAAGERLCCGI